MEHFRTKKVEEAKTDKGLKVMGSHADALRESWELVRKSRLWEETFFIWTDIKSKVLVLRRPFHPPLHIGSGPESLSNDITFPNRRPGRSIVYPNAPLALLYHRQQS